MNLDLNPQQLEAVTTTQGPLLVIAGAGSGKTRTLVYRVAYLVENGIVPESILLLTFTRRAAEEMLERASQLIDHRCRSVSGGTFHSFAFKVLRQYSQMIGFESGFTVIDRGDTEDIIQSVISEMKEKLKNIRMPKKGTISEIISKAKNLDKSIAYVLSNQFPQFADLEEIIVHIASSYDAYKHTHKLMDYDDLLLNFIKMLREHLDIREILSSHYRYIMVDEYQDTNKIQAEIIKYLSESHRNVMVVGDDSQAIYAFRGANYKNMFEFKEYFPEAKIIKLEENYRSTQHILNFTNAIMARAMNTYTKCLFTKRVGGIVPRLVDTGTESEQAIFVCDCIQYLLKRGVPPYEIAVLFRASYHSFELEAELTRRRIPYVKYGGFKFLESAHIKDLLSFFRAFLNPEDPIALGRVLMMVKNVGPSRVKKIQEWVRATKSPLTQIGQWEEDKKVRSKEMKAELERLGRLFQDLETMVSSPGRAVESVLEYYLPVLKEKYDDYPKRQRELQELIPMAERYDDIASFISDLILDPPNGSLGIEGEMETITLSTVHSAKGLEWAYVFIIWVAEGRFPSFKAYSDLEEMEEERRLLYVAATRAKDDLILTYPSEVARQIYGYEEGYLRGKTDGLSSFLLGLSEEVVHFVRFRKDSRPSAIVAFEPSKLGVIKRLRVSKQEACKKDRDVEVTDFKPGEKVKHPAFGVGIVSKAPKDDKLEVVFARYGKKLLHLKYSNLEKI
mgnify:CR=1 FL=1